MIEEILVNSIVSETIKAIRGTGVLERFSLDSNKSLLKSAMQSSLYSHVKSVQNWSNGIAFKGLNQSKSVSKTFIDLELSLTPKRERLSELEELETIPLTKAFRESGGHMVILGQPGAGKTTSMKFLCQSVINSRDSNFLGVSLPILILLRDLNAVKKIDENSGIIVDQIFKQFGLGLKGFGKEFNLTTEEGIDAFKHFKFLIISEILNRSKFLLIIEGLDELASDNRQIVLDEFRQLVNTVTNSKIILTSRTADYNYSFENVRTYEICPLSAGQILEFANKWLCDKEKVDEFIKNLENSPFHDAAIRPITIAHLCAIFERSGKIHDKPKTVYRKIIYLLLEEWDEQRRVTRGSKYANFASDRKFDFLATLAFMLTIDMPQIVATSFSKDTIERIYHSIYQDFGLRKGEVNLVVGEVESHTGLFLKSGFNLFEFAHKSLQEFLSADYIVKLGSIPSSTKEIRRLPNEMAIAVSISSNPSSYFVELINNRFDRGEYDQLFYQTFVNRLLLEKPDFNFNFRVGLAAFKLYSLMLKAANVHDPIILNLNHNIFNQFESLLTKLMERNGIEKILTYYRVIERKHTNLGVKVVFASLQLNLITSFVHTKGQKCINIDGFQIKVEELPPLIYYGENLKAAIRDFRATSGTIS